MNDGGGVPVRVMGKEGESMICGRERHFPGMFFNSVQNVRCLVTATEEDPMTTRGPEAWDVFVQWVHFRIRSSLGKRFRKKRGRLVPIPAVVYCTLGS